MSIHQLAQTGQIKMDHGASVSPPKGLVVKHDHMEGDPVLNIAIKPPRYPYWLSGLVMGIPLILIVMGLNSPDGLYISMFAFAFLLLAGMIFVPDWWSRREIEITKNFITATDPLNRSLGQSQTMKIEDIEEIAIAPPRWKIGHEVVLISGDDRIAVGVGLRTASLQWLRNCLMTAIGRV